MNLIRHHYMVDMIPEGSKTVVKLNQYDEDFLLDLELYAREGTFEIDSGTTAEIRGTKPDGNGYSASCTLTITEDENQNPIYIVTVTGDQQITAVDGDGEYEIMLVKNEQELNTANFIIRTERAALDKDTVASTSVVRELVDVLDNSEAIINAGQQYADSQAAMVILAGQASASAESAADSAESAADTLQHLNTDYETMSEELTGTISEAMDDIEEKRQAIVSLVVSANNTSTEALNKASNLENDTADLATSMASAERSIQSLENSRLSHLSNLTVINGALYGINEEGDIITDAIEGINGGGGGGGGGSSAMSTVTITNTSGFNSKTIADGDTMPLSFSWSSIESEMPTGNGTLRIMVNGVIKGIMDVTQGNVTVDVAEYLIVGSNNVRLTVTDMYDNSRFTAFNITVVSISISSTFDTSTPMEGAISYPYTPIGSVQKTIYFILDGVEIGTNVTSVTGRQMSYTIPQQSHGAHTFECYFECVINGQTVESNHLYHEMICIEPANTTPIIVSSYNRATAPQYTTLNIEYQVYDPARLAAPVTITANGTTVATLTVDRTSQVFNYRADTPGSLTIVIASGSASKTITMTITESDVDVEAETDQLALYLTSSGRSNNEGNPWTWSYTPASGTAISATMTGFNGAQNGWINDSDGITALRVMGGASVTIPYQPFATDPRTRGLTVEVELTTHNVMDYDSVIFSCMSGGRGIQMTAQEVVFRSENSEMTAQYNENDHLRISVVIEKRTETRLIQFYLNGELSRTMQYDETEDFTQPSPVGITIGSANCGVDVYNIRVYTNNLTRYQIKDNWIADTQDVTLMLQRYHHNDVYDEYGNIVIAKLPSDLPYMVIEADELPQYKGDKKNVTVHYTDPVYGSRSFDATLVQADVQGTSSQYYPVKNYKLKFKNGFVVNGTSTSGYALRQGAIEVNAFTFKADVASSEGANNVELVRLYEILARELGILTPPQENNTSIRQGIDGFPIVIFWHDTLMDTTSFVGKYNFNNDKGTENLFGFSTGDESWEVKDDESQLTKFKTNVFGENWYTEDLEARYPEDNTSDTIIRPMVNWVYSTYQGAATGDALAESYTDVDGNVHTVDNAAYRLAKFKTEFEDYFDLDDATLYYLFTLHFLMANSRQKNMFPTYWASTGKWMFLPYDFDTGLGTDNRGTLTFDYNLEDIDSVSGRTVFDGQDVVLWVNFRQAFWGEVQAMYQQLRSSGKFSYEFTEAMFEEHQSKWPVAIFNEDAFYKYINPLLTDGNTAYLEMAQGSKTLQRRFWLSNRFDYMDSLMVSGNARNNYIQLRPIYTVTEQERAAGAVDLHITPYAHIYVTVDFDSRRRQIRATRETPVTIENPAASTSFGNVIAIYSADKLADVGDLSPLQLSLADFSAATRLQRIKVGDASVSYENTHLQSLSVGTNPLMKIIDARNCSALGTGSMSVLDASGCSNIEEIYLEGTALTGATVPNGGVLNTLHLPDTTTSLIVRNQPHLSDLSVPDYSNITTLWLENVGSVVDSLTILSDISTGARVRLIGIAWECSDAAEIISTLELLDTMRGLDETGLNVDIAQVSGTIHTTSLSVEENAQIAIAKANYPYITVTADYSSSTLTYKNYDGSSTLKTVTCLNGVPQSAAPSIPSRTSTAQYSYTAVGWNSGQDQQTAEYSSSGPTSGIATNLTLYAAYTATVRTYTVTWKNSDNTTLETDNNVPYGTTPTYNGATPQNPTSGGGAFQNWSPAISPVTGNVTYTASYIVTYTVYFYNESTLLQTVTGVAAGGSATYTGATPTKTGVENPQDYDFTGWSPSNTNIQANTSCYAQFQFSGVAETITDTWDEIITAVNNGTYASKYQIGDTKKLVLGSEGAVAMKIIAFDTDDLASGGGKAPITFVSEQLLKTNHRMNPDLVTNYKYDSGASWVRSNSSSYKWTSKNSYVANNKAKMSLRITALDDGTIKLGYNAGSTSSSSVGLSLKVNDNVVVSSPVSSINRYELAITSGSTYDIEIEHESKTASNSKTGTFQIDNSSNTTMTTSNNLITVSDIVIDNCSIRSVDDYTTGTGTIGGWSASEMRTYLRETIKPLIPSNVRSAIKEVTKYSKIYNTAGSETNNVTSTEDVWIPSRREVGFSNGETSGPVYSTAFPDNASRIKSKTGASSASWWWLRSASSNDGFGYVASGGSSSNDSAYNSGGVVLGFCL